MHGKWDEMSENEIERMENEPEVVENETERGK